MGRIFETRKHTMFARWDRMAKQFTRIGKEITIAVKAGGPNPEAQPGAAPRDPERARGQHAEGQGRVGDQEGLRPGRRRLRGDRSTRATRRTASRCWSRPRPTTRRAPSSEPAHALQQGRRQPRATPAASPSCSSAWASSASTPTGIDPEALELDLIDHGLEEMGETTGEKGEPQLLIRCAFADFGHLQKALEDRGITPISAESEYMPQTPVELAEKQADRGAQADRHARAGRRRPEGLPQPRLTSRREGQRRSPISWRTKPAMIFSW